MTDAFHTSPRTSRRPSRGVNHKPDFLRDLLKLGYAEPHKHESDWRRCDIGDCPNWSLWTIGQTELCSTHKQEYDRRKAR